MPSAKIRLFVVALVGLMLSTSYLLGQPSDPPRTMSLLRANPQTTAGYTSIELFDSDGLVQITDRKQVFLLASYLDAQTPNLTRLLKYAWNVAPEDGALSTMIQQQDEFALYANEVGNVGRFVRMRASNTGNVHALNFVDSRTDSNCDNGAFSGNWVFHDFGIPPMIVGDSYGLHSSLDCSNFVALTTDMIVDVSAEPHEYFQFEAVLPLVTLDDRWLLTAANGGDVFQNIVRGPRTMFHRHDRSMGPDLPPPLSGFRLSSIYLNDNDPSLSLSKRTDTSPAEYWFASKVTLTHIESGTSYDAVWAQSMEHGYIPASANEKFVLRAGTHIDGLFSGWLLGTHSGETPFLGTTLNKRGTVAVCAKMYDPTNASSYPETTYVLAKAPNYIPVAVIRPGDQIDYNGVSVTVDSLTVSTGNPSVPQIDFNAPMLNDQDEIVVGAMLLHPDHTPNQLDALVRIWIDDAGIIHRKLVALASHDIVPSIVEAGGVFSSEDLLLTDIIFDNVAHFPVGNAKGDIAFFARLQPQTGGVGGKYLVRSNRSRCGGLDSIEGLIMEGMPVHDGVGGAFAVGNFRFEGQNRSRSGTDGRPMAINAKGQVAFVGNSVSGGGTVVLLEPSISHPPGYCPADFDDGTGTGTPDCGVTIDDLLYYLNIFADGLESADLDDGSGGGNPDGGVTIDDLIYFMDHFGSGC